MLQTSSAAFRKRRKLSLASSGRVMSDLEERKPDLEASGVQGMTSLQNGSRSLASRSASGKPEEQKLQQLKGGKNLHQTKSPKILKVILNRPEEPIRMNGCKCTECGESFKVKSALVKHLKYHAEGRPHKCMACEKSFSKKSSLVIHQQTHTERKLFTCNKCGKTFARKSNLLLHDKTHPQKKVDHKKSTGCVLKLTKHGRKLKERPYKCLECKKMFVLHKNFIKHQKSHARAVPLTSNTAHHTGEQIRREEKQAVAHSTRVEKQVVDHSELMLQELTRMRENVDMLLLNQQCQLQVLQEIQKQLGFLLPGNDLVNCNVYSLGLLLGQQALAVGSPFPFLLNPSNLLPEAARPFSSQIPS